MNFKKIASTLIIVVLIALAFYATHKFLQHYSLHEIITNLNNISLKKRIYAIFLMAASYLFLTSYDFLGLRYLGKKLAPKKVVFTSFISYAFSNFIGLSILASGSLRYRYYTSWGLSFNEVTRIIIFTTATLWVGILTVGGLAFTFEPEVTLPGDFLSHFSMHSIGILFLALVVIYLLLLVTVKKPIGIYNQQIPLPGLGIGVLQIIVGGLDWILAGSALYILLPAQLHVSFSTFIGIYLMAQTLGLISHVPGGLLVFEGVILSFFPSYAVPQVIGSILIYRVTYYIFPLLAAAFMMAMSEFHRHRKELKGTYEYINRIYGAVIPNLIFVIVFICGVYMFLTGALPIDPGRFPLVREFLPLPLVESSHFFESLIGLGLMILSRGLKKRVDLAFQLTIILLIAGTVFGITKGAEYETALFAAAVVAVMLPAKKMFNRKSPFFADALAPGWIFSMIIILMVFSLLGFFAYKHVEYRNSLWWTFTFKDQAPRFLRTLVGSITFLVALVFYRFMIPSKKIKTQPENTAELIKDIVPNNLSAYAHLAYLPDKSYLFSDTDKSFIMYGTAGRSFVSMGDPVGTEDTQEPMGDLILDFRQLAAHHGCSAAFYEIGSQYIPLYIDAGFKIFKIGEEARVKLSEFTLEGSHWSGARNTIKKLEKTGCSLKVIPRDEAADIMPEIKRISDEWLAGKNTREKKFSLGCFNEEYVMNTQVAVIYCEEKPVAFANLWPSGGKKEISVDMMRYANDAPQRVMEYLFLELMLYARDEGYEYFSLGMAPLSGIEVHPYSPFWNKVASTIYNHGERFYNFKGLRSYKDKFKPEWEPKYIAVQGFFSLPKTLTNIASLISGGTAGIFRK